MKLGMILYIGNLHISKQLLKRINGLIKDIISLIFSQLFKRKASTNKRNKSEDSRRLG